VDIGNDGDGLPRTEAGLGGLATFTLDSRGRVTSWSATAARLFGRPAAVVGQQVTEVLLTGPGQRDLVREALDRVAAGQAWSATVAGGSLGRGEFTLRLEPLTGLGGGAVALAQRVSPRPRLLSEATARIGTTLDLAQTAREVTEVAVPGFADAVAIYGSERLLAVDEFAALRAAPGSAVRRLAARVEGQGSTVISSHRPSEVLVFDPESPPARAMATGRAVLYDHLSEETVQRLARWPGFSMVVGCTSFLAMPLVARGTVVGCATFARAEGSPPFGPADITLAAELASRAAVCIDNARLYRRERRTALALQRGLLPGQPDVPPGLEVARSYTAVGDSVVGGDWHDIVALPGGRAALIVGDAMGHGPEAAAVMVQLRTAAHTLAGLDLPPHQILRMLDDMASGMPAPFATCIHVVIDPAASSCLAVQAGHLPPILVLPGGATEVLDLPTGLPLGLGGGSFDPATVSLPPGATLALYTDGLVESRTRPLDDGLAALRSALAGTVGSALDGPGLLQEACDTVARKLRQHGEDDITLVLARVRS
jgi:serine phosphatase RsbU (regulator of sigma subunit)